MHTDRLRQVAGARRKTGLTFIGSATEPAASTEKLPFPKAQNDSAHKIDKTEDDITFAQRNSGISEN